MTSKIDVIGDNIENPFNAKTMIDIAAMFESSCLFRESKSETEESNDIEDDIASGASISAHSSIEMPQRRLITCDSMIKSYRPIVALDNLDNAADLYGFKLPAGTSAALVAGNERRGISREVQKAATDVVQIPMFGARLNTINVAAASGVALYYLFNGFGGKLQSRNQPETRRPELMFIGGKDHIELGSAIRSAGAFGWSRLFVEDRENVWFGCDRVIRSEGRGAARRGRNSIRLVPVTKDRRYNFKEILVVSKSQGTAITREDLARGSKQLLVVPDESLVDVENEDWTRFGANVRFVNIKAPANDYTYHYRFFASVTLAESSRQIGRRPAGKTGRSEKLAPVYDSALSLVDDQRGEVLYLDELADY